MFKWLVRTKNIFAHPARYGSTRNVYFGQFQNYNTKSYNEVSAFLCVLFFVLLEVIKRSYQENMEFCHGFIQIC